MNTNLRDRNLRRFEDMARPAILHRLDLQRAHGLSEQLTGFLEPDAQVEPFGPVLGGVPEDGNLLLSAPSGLFPNLLDGESADTASLGC